MTDRAASPVAEIDFHIEASEIIHRAGGVEFFDVSATDAKIMLESETVALDEWLHELNKFNDESERMSDEDLREIAVDICFTVMPGVIPEELLRRESDQTMEVVND